MALFTYYTDDVRMVRKNKPEVWSIVEPGGQPEKMYRGYPFLSFIPGTQGAEQPIQKDKFVIDLDTKEIACLDARKIIDWFECVYGVDPDQWSVMLSGKKGIHLELSNEILGVENGHKYLMLAYKHLALDIEGELQVKLDTSMYTMGVSKPFRQANVMRDTGTCKRQIWADDLYEITSEEEYLFSCSEPGKTWQPENIEKNDVLAAKIDFYLAESVKHQEEIKNAPKLSPDDLDRLSLCIPPCMVTLANMTSFAKGNTFNDIALQLTAYAVTAGMSENDFMAGCAPFIEHYPSTSLNTPEKRYENCRARFRTMAANGNQHSCGGVLSLKIPGFDCDTCPSKTSGPALTVDVMSANDMQVSSLTLNIPEDISNPGGLISLGMQALRAPGFVDIPQYNLPVVLTTIANAIAGKIVFGNQWPNLYNIKVGPTSSGKTSSDQAMVTAITDVGIPGFYGVTDFASGPALMRSIAENPTTFIVIDEATSLFKRYAQADANSDGKRDALLEIYSKSGGKIKKAYSDTRNTIDIDFPCLSLTGNATPVIFDAIKQEDFDTGTMQRFDFWCYDGPIPERGFCKDDGNEYLIKFAEAIARIRAARPSDGNLAGMGGGLCSAANIGITDKGAEVLTAWSKEITSRTNAARSDGEGGIISRGFNLCIKYAMIHLAATRPVEALFLPLDESDIEYGKKVAWMLADWKINVLRDRVTTGDFHHNCEIFKQAIAAATKTGVRPTFKFLANRRPALKNWKRKDSEEIISVLEKRGEIARDEKTPTAYFLTKSSL